MQTKEEREEIRLNVVPEPQQAGGRAVLYPGGVGRGTEIMSGVDKDSPDTFCGGCGVRLTYGLSKKRLEQYVMRCKTCGDFNEL
jgi:hypothetical protein